MLDTFWGKIGAAVVATIVIVGGLFVIWKSTSTPAAPKQVSVTINPTDHQIGTDSAKITLVEYSDFQCPACRAYHGIVKQVISEYKDNIRFIYRHFPLTQIHQNALAASYAAEAAAQQGKFF
ncbi:MAG: DSBA-like thioredoxin domain protein [Microgenomates bacterium OLB22]|nr:MAG: DSBA-like thioredoxin domain protein [Microgenomates bacterium OLB22]